MRTYGFVALLAFSLVSPAASASSGSNTTKRLILFQGFILNAYYNDKYVEVKRIDVRRGRFYGYGWLDNDRVFVAYQNGGGEAYAEMEIIDLRHGRTTKLKGIGGVGESNFDVNTNTGEIIYSTDADINVIKVDLENSTYEIKNVKKDTYCWGVFWIDSETIGCKLMDKDGTPFVKFTVPQMK